MIVGTKKGMTRVFKGEKSVPVTIIDVTDCVISLKDASGIEIGIGKKKANKAMSMKYKELGFVPAHRQYVKGEFDVKVGDKVSKEIFEIGSMVEVKSTAKGKGFAGVVKRWGFAGGPKTRGQSDRHRAPGSIGAGTDPGRVLKGKRMGGRKGGNSITLKNKEVVDVIDNYLLISGPVPGSNGDSVVIVKQN